MQSKIKCLIVDDEEAGHHVLINYIGYVDSLELSGQCYNVLEAINLLHKQQVDLIFLDINMPELSGFDLIKTLTNPPAIILTTAYSTHALESYNFGVIDYLLKPIEFSRFLKSIDRFFSLRAPLLSEPEKLLQQQELTITVKVDGDMIDVPLSDIIYTQSLGNYVKVVTRQKKYLCSITTTDIEKRLPHARFMRIHKSHIISLEKIDKFLYTSVMMDGVELPVGITYRRKLEEKLKED